MAHPLALILVAALAASAARPAPRVHRSAAQLSPRVLQLIGRAAYDGPVQGEWNGWTSVRQTLLEKEYASQAFRTGTRHLVTLERRLPEAGPQGAFTVIAAIEFDVPKGHALSEQGYCEVKGQPATPLLFAVVPAAKPSDEYHRAVRAAWRIDLAKERIEPLDPATVRCGNAAYSF